MTKKTLRIAGFVLSAFLLASCNPKMVPHQTGITTQTQKVDTKLKRSDYTLMDRQFMHTVVNTKAYKKYSVDRLKETAFMQAEKIAIMSGADGVLNPVYMVDQKGKKYYVTARVKGYQLKNDNDYVDMENNLKHNPNN